MNAELVNALSGVSLPLSTNGTSGLLGNSMSVSKFGDIAMLTGHGTIDFRNIRGGDEKASLDLYVEV